jgi:hypothetical protein
MRYLKMLGLIAMAAAALMAFAGSASAQTFTAPAGTEYTGSWGASLEGSIIWNLGFAEITCTAGTVAGKLTTNNNTEASGSITSWGFSNCKEGQTVDTLNNSGTLTILKSTHAVSGTGTEVTFAVAGVSCVYSFGSTSTPLGTASNTGSGITLKVHGTLKITLGGFLCANSGTVAASFIFTNPFGSILD